MCITQDTIKSELDAKPFSRYSVLFVIIFDFEMGHFVGYLSSSFKKSEEQCEAISIKFA